MSKISTSVLATLFSVVLLATLAWGGTDYSVFDNDELYAMRETVQKADKDDQEAFQREWQRRVDKMSDEELKRYPQDKAATRQLKKSIIPGRGYEQQGMGTVIYGGTQ